MSQPGRDGQITLAIETAVGGGSVSLLRKGSELASINGGVSRAEEVLTGIERLLAEAGMMLADVDLIAVSLGPGSFTGIRIGIATVLGLRTSTNARCIGVSSLEAMSILFPNENRIAVLPLGRGNYAVQEFHFSADLPAEGRAPFVIGERELLTMFDDRSDFEYLLLEEEPKMALPGNGALCTDVLATLIGKSVFAGNGTETLEPLYLRNQ